MATDFPSHPNQKKDSPFCVEGSGFGSRVVHLNECDSTNRVARELASDGASDGLVVMADFQYSGRGRFSRTWWSQPGQNLLLTVVLRRNVSHPARIPLAAALAVRQVAADMLPHELSGANRSEDREDQEDREERPRSEERPMIKWPNDVLIGRRKVSGILVESPSEGVFLVGIGFNVNQIEFSGEFKAEPTSLFLELGRPVDRTEVFSRLMVALEASLENMTSADFMATYRHHLVGIGEEAVLEDGRIVSVDGVSDDGGLLVHSNKGRETLFAGDVTLRTH